MGRVQAESRPQLRWREAVILEALRRSGGNREKAAELLEVSEATFYRKLKTLRELGRIPPIGAIRDRDAE